MKSIERKIAILLLLCIVGLRLLLIFPHRPLGGVCIINSWVQLLLFIIAGTIFWKSKGGQRFVYLNYALYFAYIIPLLFGSFIGECILKDYTYAGFYHYFYVDILGSGLVALFVIIYVLIDYIFQLMQVWQKYLLSFIITSIIIVISYSPFIFKPTALYSQDNYKYYLHYQKFWLDESQELGRSPKTEELASKIIETDKTNTDNSNVLISRLQILRPYFESGNNATLFWKPLFIRSVIINLIAILLLVAILSIMYLMDKPYYPYVDKIIMTFIPLFVLEAFHNYGNIDTIWLNDYQFIFIIEQYASIAVFLLIAYVFYLGLRFVVSPVGPYYSELIEKSPNKITRWCDEIDTFVLKVFVKKEDSIIK